MANSTTLVRKPSGQLVETQFAGGQAKPAAQTPTTPAGTAGAGGTPDQAKMSGTPAQKAPVLEKAVQPAQSLQATERLTPTPPTAQADAAATAAAGTLNSMGSFGTAIRAAIAQALTPPAVAPTLTVKDEALVAFSPEQQVAIKAAVAQYNPSTPSVSFQAIARAMGRDTLSPADIETLFGPQAAAAAVAAATPPARGQVTLGQLDWGAIGVTQAQVEQDLGIPVGTLASMTPDQFQQAAEGAVHRELNKVNSLKAELATASPNRKAQIFRELRALDASGQAGLEASVADLGARLDAAETITIAGRPFDVAEVLGDEGISKLIQNAVYSAPALAKLKADPTTAGLAGWIETNRDQLQHVLDDMSKAAGGFAETQEAVGAAVAEIGLPGSDVAQAFGLPEGPLTDTELTAFKAKLDADPVYQAATAEGGSELLTAIQQDPTLKARFDGQTPEQIAAAVATHDVLGAASEDAKAAFKALGFDTAGWLTNPAQVLKAQQFADAFAKLEGKVALPDVISALLTFKPGRHNFAQYVTPAVLLRLGDSMALIAEYSDNPEKQAAIKKLWGLKPEATFIDPLGKLSLNTMHSLAKQFTLAQRAVKAARGLQTDFFALVADGTVNTAAELTAVTKNPKLISTIAESRRTDTQVKALETTLQSLQAAKNDAGLTKPLRVLRDQISKFVLGPNGTAAALDAMLDGTAAVLRSKKANDHKYTKKAYDRATYIQNTMIKMGLDLDGDHKITAHDLEFISPNQSGLEWRDSGGAELAARTVAAIRRLSGIQAPDAILAGADTTSSLTPGSSLADAWNTYGATPFSLTPKKQVLPADVTGEEAQRYNDARALVADLTAKYLSGSQLEKDALKPQLDKAKEALASVTTSTTTPPPRQEAGREWRITEPADQTKGTHPQWIPKSGIKTVFIMYDDGSDEATQITKQYP